MGEVARIQCIEPHPMLPAPLQGAGPAAVLGRANPGSISHVNEDGISRQVSDAPEGNHCDRLGALEDLTWHSVERTGLHQYRQLVCRTVIHMMHGLTRTGT